MFRSTPTPLAGNFVIENDRMFDNRGFFQKTFHAPEFEKLGLRTDFREQYYSFSQIHVLRGLHFQAPPHHHVKIVRAIAGKIVDVILDLRRNSETYGQHFAIELGADSPKALYVAEGMAHGFLSLEPGTIVSYLVTTEFAPKSEGGIRWDSFGYRWPVSEPIVSDKDKQMPSFKEYNSPF